MTIKTKKVKDDRINLKLTPKLGDELAYLSKVTGKSRIQILSEYLDSLTICASAYRNFIYYVHIHGTDNIEIKFVGQPAIISGSAKVTSPEQIKSLEKQIYDDAIKVSKGCSFNHIAKKMSKNRQVK